VEILFGSRRQEVTGEYILLFTEYYWGDQIKDDGVCRPNRGNEKYVHNFGITRHIR
jgi:hypothetical protein